jgi:hypothetical protein
MYEKMPFGLINAVATFQREMDIAFVGEISMTPALEPSLEEEPSK